ESDEAAIAEAMHVLHWPRRFPDGPLGLLTARPSVWGGVRRMARLLVIEPLQRGRHASPGAGPDDSALQQWKAAARFLLDPSSRRAVRTQTARVRRLRRWALKDC
ncbi:MAG TPA: hypothetical protein VFX39_06330, partial [Gemmatimonadaceae bacterium]|nr:hypothetical protein [Gemmatimonadaceae bacterium]